jgi:carotenoid cleavage dioxygenase-like enzyme
MHRDGRLTYIGHETFDSALDYPFTAHPLKDGEDLLFHSYTTDETVR